MYVAYLIVGGLIVVGLGYGLKRLGLYRFRYSPSAIVRLGHAWGRFTDRSAILRALNTMFYITGMLVTLTGLTLAVSNVVRPENKQAQAPALRPAVVKDFDENELLRLVNAERKKHGLRELKEDTRLTKVAQERLDDMVKNQYYAHISPNGMFFYDLMKNHMLHADYACENLNLEFTTDESVYIQSWHTSTKGHRECMLQSDATAAGYAVGEYGETPETKIYIAVAIHATPVTKKTN